MDITMLEFKKIADERQEELRNAFISVTTDFWMNSHCKEQFGALVPGIIVEKYEFAHGMTLFISRQTAKSFGEDVLSTMCNNFSCLCVVFLI